MIEFTRSEWVLLIALPVIGAMAYAIGYCQGRIDEYKEWGGR